MKTLILYMLFLSACNSQGNKILSNSQNSADYQVAKIEVLENYYILHLKKDDFYYKVLQPKPKTNICKKIELNKSYGFSLVSIWNNTITLEDGRTFNSPLNVDCKDFEGVGKICLEDDKNYIRDLFKIENISSICVIE